LRNIPHRTAIAPTFEPHGTSPASPTNMWSLMILHTKSRMTPQCPLWANSGHAELVGRTAHSPCPRRQVNTAVAIYRKIGAYAVTQSGTPILGKRHAVTRRWCLTTKKWRPVIVKVSENRGDIDWADRHVIDAGTPKEGCQWFWMTHRKPVAFVK